MIGYGAASGDQGAGRGMSRLARAPAQRGSRHPRMPPAGRNTGHRCERTPRRRPSERMTTLALIAAVARNGVIGHGNALLWRLPEDLRHFRRTTIGAPVIMGARPGVHCRPPSARCPAGATSSSRAIRDGGPRAPRPRTRSIRRSRWPPTRRAPSSAAVPSCTRWHCRAPMAAADRDRSRLRGRHALPALGPRRLRRDGARDAPRRPAERLRLRLRQLPAPARRGGLAARATVVRARAPPSFHRIPAGGRLTIFASAYLLMYRHATARPPERRACHRRPPAPRAGELPRRRRPCAGCAPRRATAGATSSAAPSPARSPPGPPRSPSRRRTRRRPTLATRTSSTLPAHSKGLGQPVATDGYGKPSKHEANVQRRRVPGLTQTRAGIGVVRAAAVAVRHRHAERPALRAAPPGLVGHRSVAAPADGQRPGRTSAPRSSPWTT